MAKYEVFRVTARTGLTSYCGIVDAVGLSVARAVARDAMSYNPRTERLVFREVGPNDGVRPTCLVCCKPALSLYEGREGFPSCGSLRCEMRMQGGIDAAEQGVNR